MHDRARWRSTSRAGLTAFGLAGALVAASAAVVPACGTDAAGVEACRKIERVRCESAPACGIELRRPLHSGDAPENDVAACIRYYDHQCLHGIVGATEDPAPQAVDACVEAIIVGDCEVVRTPESHPACAFLVPPPPAPPADASEGDSAADDATTD